MFDSLSRNTNQCEVLLDPIMKCSWESVTLFSQIAPPVFLLAPPGQGER